jgi:hypothetical protein
VAAELETTNIEDIILTMVKITPEVVEAEQVSSSINMTQETIVGLAMDVLIYQLQNNIQLVQVEQEL